MSVSIYAGDFNKGNVKDGVNSGTSINYKENNAELEKKVTEAGVEIIDLTPEELAPFAEATASVWDEVKADCGETVYTAFMNALEASK